MAAIPRKYIDNYTKSLNALSADVQKRLADDLTKIDFTADVAVIRDAVIGRMEFYLGPYTDMAAAVAAEFYDGLREASLGSKVGALAESMRKPEATEGAVRAFVQDIVNGKPTEVFTGKVLGRADAEIKKAANECVAYNADHDKKKVRYARVPSGGETCPFCMMLASRGAVYRNEELASHAHANCDCRVVPDFGDGIEGYDPDYWYSKWRGAEVKEGATKKSGSIGDANDTAADIIRNAYESNRTYKGLNAASLDELNDVGFFDGRADYGQNTSVEVADSFNSVLSKLTREYASDLQLIRPMTASETLELKTAFASVFHDYSTGSATLILNPLKIGNAEKLAERVLTLSRDGHSVKIKDGAELEYIATHEFAHTLIDMQSSLNRNRNWVGYDYEAVKKCRKEIEKAYDEYIKEIKSLTADVSRHESEVMEALLNGDYGAHEAALAKYEKAYDGLNSIKISEYSLTNSDEFMAEAFTQAKIGESSSKYSDRVIEIIDRYFKR